MPPRKRGQVPAQPTDTRDVRPKRASPHSQRSPDDSATTVVELIPVARITASQRNPRRRLHGIDELAASLASHGLLQPVVVRPGNDEHFELVAGHRRLAAAAQLGWATIPAVIRSATQDEAYVLTIVENLQREDLSPREESDALAVLVKERKWSTHQVAAAIQRSQGYVSKRLRVFGIGLGCSQDSSLRSTAPIRCESGAGPPPSRLRPTGSRLAFRAARFVR